MKVLQHVKERTGCKVFHALKAYASFATFPMMSRYLDGVCASGLNEARLGYEEFKKEVHTFSAAYRENEIKAILKYSDSIIFNSFYQLQKYGKTAKKSGVEIGLRINPGHSEVKTAMYDPCASYSRLGIVHSSIQKRIPPTQEQCGWPALSCDVPAECRRARKDIEVVREALREIHQGPEMGEFRRRPPHNDGTITT